MIKFSIRVASVIGKLSVVPKQAHSMVCLVRNFAITPIVVMPKTIVVMISAMATLKRSSKTTASNNSING